MAGFELPGIIPVGEYDKAYPKRMPFESLRDNQIALMLLRIEHHHDLAVRDIVRLQKPSRSRLGKYGLDVALLDDNFREQGVLASGRMRDGIWNTSGPENRLFTKVNGEDYPVYDGIIRPFGGEMTVDDLHAELSRLGLRTTQLSSLAVRS